MWRAEVTDGEFVRSTLRTRWGGTHIAVHGDLINAAELPAFVAWRSGERVGLLTFKVHEVDMSWEIVSLDSIVQRRGVGTALLDAVRRYARARVAERLWLVTTNDNTAALRFYQRRGFDLVVLNRGGVENARKLKPAIPTVVDGIPVRHELVLSIVP